MEYFDLRTVLDHETRQILREDREKLSKKDQLRKDFFSEICEETDRKNTKRNWRNASQRK